MGTVFSIYKRKPKQRYELGKHYRGFRDGLEPCGISALIEKIAVKTRLIRVACSSEPVDMELVSRLQCESLEISDPGWAAMWSIMGTPNYSVFRMSRWTREELADKLYRASQNIDTLEQALVVADHLLAWAGDDDVTLNPEEVNDLADLGWPTRGYRDTGSIWQALRGENA